MPSNFPTATTEASGSSQDHAPPITAVTSGQSQREVDRWELSTLLLRLQERRKIMWNAPLKDGGYAKLVAPEDLRDAIDWLAALLIEFDGIYPMFAPSSAEQVAGEGSRDEPKAEGAV